MFLVVAGLVGTILVTGLEPKLGLDLQGGLSVVLTAPKGTGSDKINEAVNTLRNRIDRAGVGEPQISREGTSNILIEIPGVKDSVALLKLVGQTAQLQFRPVISTLSPGDPGYATATVATSADAKDQQLTLGGPSSTDKVKYVVGPVAVDGSGVSGASAIINPSTGAWSVNLDFKSDAAKAWTTFTGKLACNQAGSPTKTLRSCWTTWRSRPPPWPPTLSATPASRPATHRSPASATRPPPRTSPVQATGALPVKPTQSTVQSVSATPRQGVPGCGPASSPGPWA